MLNDACKTIILLFDYSIIIIIVSNVIYHYMIPGKCTALKSVYVKKESRMEKGKERGRRRKEDRQGETKEKWRALKGERDG